jgi:GNAT superfamily N-acetyltransferase
VADQGLQPGLSRRGRKKSCPADAAFVRPQARGRGVGEAVIEAVAGWAIQKGATAVHLWVTETNKRARMLYERCGFTATDERQPLPSDPALIEIGMLRPL